MRLRMWLALASIVTLLGTGTGLLAQQVAAPTGPPAPPNGRASSSALSSGDQRFLQQAARDGIAEVELGRLASERGASDAVKQFGQRMVNDHGKANDELKRLAEQKGVNLPTDLSRKDTRARDKLAKLSGEAFDRAYINDMAKDHRQDVAAFRRESQRAKDPDVKQWAAQTLPTLEDHMKAVEQLQGTVGKKS